jgi:SAM domain (Sterile alpha motif)
MDVAVWLRSPGLGKYEALFRENDIDEVLPTLTAEDLKELGVASFGHRRKLLDAIRRAAYRRESATPVPPRSPVVMPSTAAAVSLTPCARRHKSLLVGPQYDSSAQLSPVRSPAVAYGPC